MKVKCVALREFSHTSLGNVPVGAEFELPEAAAKTLSERARPIVKVLTYDTKVIVESPVIPTVTAGVEVPSSASPAVQASPETTAPASPTGKRRGRPRKDAASQQTPAT